MFDALPSSFLQYDRPPVRRVILSRLVMLDSAIYTAKVKVFEDKASNNM